MCCNLTNCLPSGDAYNNNQEFQEVSEIVLTTQPDWPLSDCWEHKRPKVQGRCPRWSDPVEVGVLYTPLSIDRSGWPTCLISLYIIGVSALMTTATTTPERRWARTSVFPTSASSGSAPLSLSPSSLSPALFAQFTRSITQDDHWPKIEDDKEYPHSLYEKRNLDKIRTTTHLKSFDFKQLYLRN